MMMPLLLQYSECLCVQPRFPTELRKSPYLQMSHQRESPRTLWTTQVLYNGVSV